MEHAWAHFRALCPIHTLSFRQPPGSTLALAPCPTTPNLASFPCLLACMHAGGDRWQALRQGQLMMMPCVSMRLQKVIKV